MTSDRKNHLRRVMTLAWALFREPSSDQTFSEALKGAWTFLTNLARMKPWRGAGRAVIAGTISSPVRAFCGNRAQVGGRRSHAYQTSRMGR
ncbi:MAG: hypothetical protein Q8S03_11070 [Brevundimonas sp.]|uniref:hypothetical protein n=1 Tax=Brevundimonas sp. TaxID=1871086 RepID=UPI002736ACF4|nr:hypothetical protein [Brevundimonas sp.]MDP3405223.1 hypothetical protein [Brevundimonas sp.]